MSMLQRCYLVLAAASLLLSNMGVQAQPWTACGCPQSCGEAEWERDADGHTCGDRINWLIDSMSYSASRACRTVAGFDFPGACGGCHPDTCQQQESPQRQSAPAPAPPASNAKCGCNSCTDQILNRNAGGHSCGNRIAYLMEQMGQAESQACTQIGGVEFSSVCGACNPQTCSNNGNAPAPAPAPSNDGNREPPNADFGPPSELYCFPPTASRTTYTNVWGAYTVEVKEGASCGPSDNLFSKETVSVSNDRRELTLQMKMVGGSWHAGEVRVLLPPSQPFHYGRYSFSVKSVQVIDSRSRQVVDTKLPPSLILGLFTWDATENYAIRENFNHEVDVEISQWNIPGQEDAQFLVQPPGFPQTKRFYSGGQPGTYNQANDYGFDWKPGEIKWFSSAAGGQSFTYNVQSALAMNQPDYTQCMPAQVEVRMNLWNLFGSVATPTDLQDYHVVSVVIDNFAFTPSGLRAIPNGGLCTKDCQCGDQGSCFQNKCATVATSSLLDVNDTGVIAPHFTTVTNPTPITTPNSTIDAASFSSSMLEDLQDPIFFSLLMALIVTMSLAFFTMGCLALKCRSSKSAAKVVPVQEVEFTTTSVVVDACHSKSYTSNDLSNHSPDDTLKSDESLYMDESHVSALDSNV